MDGALDVSYFLASVYGFIPFAMLVTEPAVGYGVAGGHSGVWRNDRIRYVGAALQASVNLTYYPFQIPLAYNFNLETFFFLQQIAFRLGKIKLFGGVRYQIAATTVAFDLTNRWALTAFGGVAKAWNRHKA